MEVLTRQLGSRERLKVLTGFLLSLLISTQAPSYGLVLKPIQGGCPLFVHSSRGVLLVDTPKGAHYLSPRSFMIGSGWPLCSLVQNYFSKPPSSLRSGVWNRECINRGRKSAWCVADDGPSVTANQWREARDFPSGHSCLFSSTTLTSTINNSELF